MITSNTMNAPAIDFLPGPQPTWYLWSLVLDCMVTATSSGLSLLRMRNPGGNMWEGAPGNSLLWLSLNQPERVMPGPWRMKDWRVVEEADAAQLEVDFETEVNGGALTLVETLWLSGDLPVLRHWVSLTNNAAQPVRVDCYHLLDIAFEHDTAQSPVQACYVDTFAGHPRDRWEPGDLNLDVHERMIGPTTPLRLWAGAYQQQCSWLALRREGDSGIVCGLEYDGAVELRAFDVAHTAGGSRWCAQDSLTMGVRLAAAPSDPLNATLAPGETWTSPAAFCALYQGDWDHAVQVTHALVEQHLAPPMPDEHFPYAVFNTWGYAFNLTRDALDRCLDVAVEIGVEMFDADYGWQKALGEWTPVDVHMPLLGDLSRMVHERGMRFGVWMAFANAGPGSAVLAGHPEWVTAPDDWGSFHSRALCMANPDTRDWAARQAIDLVRDYQIDYLKHDFELIKPCVAPHHHHPPDPAGYHSALGYREVLLKLRQAHPKLMIENCQGGARIMSYAMVQTHDTSISSDGPVLGDALYRRKALMGMSYAFPLRYCANYMEERPSDYACHSSMIGGPWIIMDRATEWTARDIANAKGNVALYKQLRPLIRRGKTYHLRMPTGNAWDALQLLGDDGRGAVLAFQPHGAKDEDVLIPLRGLDPTREYSLRSTRGDHWHASGSLLMRQGFYRVMKPGTSEVVWFE